MGDSTDEDVVDFERAWALMESPGKWSRLFHRVDEVGVIDLLGLATSPDLPLHRLLIHLFLWLAVKDRATAIQFEPCPSSDIEVPSSPALKIGYVIDGSYDDLVPPPGEIWPRMVREFEDLTGLSSIRHRLASWLHKLASRIDGQPRPYREGRFHLRVDDEILEVGLVACPSDQGEQIYLTLPPVSASVSDRVWAERTRLFKIREPENQGDAPGPLSATGDQSST